MTIYSPLERSTLPNADADSGHKTGILEGKAKVDDIPDLIEGSE